MLYASYTTIVPVYTCYNIARLYISFESYVVKKCDSRRRWLHQWTWHL